MSLKWHPSGVSILGNLVNGVGLDPNAAVARVGIAVVACAGARVAGNTVAAIGPVAASIAGSAVGIMVHSPAQAASVDQNTVGSTMIGAAEHRDDWTALLVFSGAGPGGVNTVDIAGCGSVTLDGVWAYLQSAAPTRLIVSGNCLYGGGGIQPTAKITLASGDVVLTANQCDQPTGKDAPAIQVRTDSAVVQANRVRGGEPSINLSAPDSVVLGNITSGDIIVNSQKVSLSGKPWSQLNATA